MKIENQPILLSVILLHLDNGGSVIGLEFEATYNQISLLQALTT